MIASADKKTVMVGLSGGVDSSVSAALLQRSGYNVIGVFIRTWQPEWLTCTWRDDRRDAMRVAAHLGIPFLECDLTEEYRTGVAEYMIEEYRRGRTPNPDVMCNRVIKFGGFLDWARSKGVSMIATGHYAQHKVSQSEGKHTLWQGNDEGKDQSYFLWMLNQEQLAASLFPVGNLNKNKVRELAKSFGLPTASRPDSQGVCFLGDIDMKDFLSHYIDATRGQVLNKKGRVIGHHDGAVLYTIGERHGFIIDDPESRVSPQYVVAKDLKRNTLTVAAKGDNVLNARTTGTIALLHTVNIITGKGLLPGQKLQAQVRYHGKKRQVIVSSYSAEKQVASVILPEPATLALGQSLVFYDGDQCLGGGIIDEISSNTNQ